MEAGELAVRSRKRALLSCTECHRRKQKCNRATPCRECMERKIPHKCAYKPIEVPTHNEGTRLRNPISSTTRVHVFSPESVAALAATNSALQLIDHSAADKTSTAVASTAITWYKPGSDTDWTTDFHPYLMPSSSLKFYRQRLNQYLGSFDPFSSLPVSVLTCPVKMTLIQYYIARLAPWLSKLEDEGPLEARGYAWLPDAVHHPALFHGTLLCSAVHLQRIQPRKLNNPQIPLWLKTETLRLLNETLENTSNGPSDDIILTTLILLYWNVGAGNMKEYEIHLLGIHKMLKIRGGISYLGLRGIVKNWLANCYGPWEDSWRDGYFKELI